MVNGLSILKKTIHINIMKNFEQYLMDKYPDLFYNNEEGLTCPCGVWVPQGWENIVDDLCGAISTYTKHTYRFEKEVINKAYYLWRGIELVIDKLHLGITKHIPILNTLKFNKPIFSFLRWLALKKSKHIKWGKTYPESITIDQIKEKFGGLRFYFTGGDAQINGMVRFAEYLCDHTCEVTGKAGKSYTNSHNWTKTLCEEEAIKLGYKHTDEYSTQES